jgi:prefoldin alpha subunit
MAEIKVPKKLVQANSGEENPQENIIIYQIMQKQLEHLKEELTMAERRSAESEATRQGIVELKAAGDVLSPIGSGCYAFSRIADGKHLLVDIGAGVLLKRTPEEAEKIIGERAAELAHLKSELQKEAEKLIGEMNKLAMQIRQ